LGNCATSPNLAPERAISQGTHLFAVGAFAFSLVPRSHLIALRKTAFASASVKSGSVRSRLRLGHLTLTPTAGFDGMSSASLDDHFHDLGSRNGLHERPISRRIEHTGWLRTLNCSFEDLSRRIGRAILNTAMCCTRV
jgi:hypothetical protein